MPDITLPDTPTYGVLSTAEKTAGFVLQTTVPNGTQLVNPTTNQVIPVAGTLDFPAASTPSVYASQQVH